MRRGRVGGGCASTAEVRHACALICGSNELLNISGDPARLDWAFHDNALSFSSSERSVPLVNALITFPLLIWLSWPLESYVWELHGVNNIRWLDLTKTTLCNRLTGGAAQIFNSGEHLPTEFRSVGFCSSTAETLTEIEWTYVNECAEVIWP